MLRFSLLTISLLTTLTLTACGDDAVVTSDPSATDTDSVSTGNLILEASVINNGSDTDTLWLNLYNRSGLDSDSALTLGDNDTLNLYVDGTPYTLSDSASEDSDSETSYLYSYTQTEAENETVFYLKLSRNSTYDDTSATVTLPAPFTFYISRSSRQLDADIEVIWDSVAYYSSIDINFSLTCTSFTDDTSVDLSATDNGFYSTSLSDVFTDVTTETDDECQLTTTLTRNASGQLEDEWNSDSTFTASQSRSITSAIEL